MYPDTPFLSFCYCCSFDKFWVIQVEAIFVTMVVDFFYLFLLEKSFLCWNLIYVYILEIE